MRLRRAIVLALASAFSGPALSSTPSAADATQAPLGAIAGDVTSYASGTELGGICVDAIPVSGSPGHWRATRGTYSARSVASGSYRVPVPVNEYVIEFDPSCGGAIKTGYAIQFYSGTDELPQAQAVFAAANTVSSGLDAQLSAASAISGSVLGQGGQPVQGACISAVSADGAVVNRGTSTQTGSFSIDALPGGSYAVYFDPTCGGTAASTYAREYYPSSPDLAQASRVVVPPEVVGLRQSLALGAAIRGTAVAPGTADSGGICISAVASDGSSVATTTTAPTGAFDLGELPPGSYGIYFDPTCGGAQSSYFGPTLDKLHLALAAGTVRARVNERLALRSGPALEILTRQFPSAVQYSRYLKSVQYQGPSRLLADYHWTVSGLPRGLRLTNNIVGGRPQVVGSYTVRMTITTSASVPPLVAHATFRIKVRPR